VYELETEAHNLVAARMTTEDEDGSRGVIKST
jgi:hypothetical protein